MDCSDDGEMWDWQSEDLCLQKEINLDISHCLWDGISQNEEEIPCMFSETTPIKDCGDLAYQDIDTGGKKSEKCTETSSQLKRRRMLQFDSEMSSAFFKSGGREETIEKASSDMSQWVSEFAEDTSASGYEGPDQSSEEWFANCFSNAGMHFSPDDMNSSGASDVQIDITEFCNIPPECEANMVQELPTGTRQNVVFKGRQSYMRTPTKLASSVAYPFAFIKPCGAHGDVTLKDINQKIRTPPPSKSMHTKEDPSASFPTSAFSGKPVVGKTKIRTEGGKGSITIMRTKG